MRHFLAALFAFCMILGTNQLLASEVENHFTSSWDSNVENLQLNLYLSKGIKFPKNYATFKLKNGEGKGCELVCKPTKKGTVFSSEGLELKEIKFTIIVNNLGNSLASYKLIAQSSYKSKKKHHGTTTSQSTIEGMINTSAIDLTQQPEFTISKENSSHGVISFKNLVSENQ